jgi:hypothetical protein
LVAGPDGPVELEDRSHADLGDRALHLGGSLALADALRILTRADITLDLDVGALVSVS